MRFHYSGGRKKRCFLRVDREKRTGSQFLFSGKSGESVHNHNQKYAAGSEGLEKLMLKVRGTLTRAREVGIEVRKKK